MTAAGPPASWPTGMILSSAKPSTTASRSPSCCAKLYDAPPGLSDAPAAQPAAASGRFLSRFLLRTQKDNPVKVWRRVQNSAAGSSPVVSRSAEGLGEWFAANEVSGASRFPGNGRLEPVIDFEFRPWRAGGPARRANASLSTLPSGAHNRGPGDGTGRASRRSAPLPNAAATARSHAWLGGA